MLQFPRKKPLLLGHRGCRGKMPENTFAAFDYALEAGCDGIEFDVRKTADSRAIVMHDAKLKGLPIADATYEALLERRSSRLPRMFSFVSAAAPKLQLEPIPCVDEVVEYYSESAFLYIELKVEGLEKETIELVRRAQPQKGYVIASFLPDVVKTLRELEPKAQVGLISDTHRDLARLSELNCSHVMPHYRLLNETTIREWKDLGKKVFTWTVNNAADMRRVDALGVDGILSDDPQLLVETLRA